MAKKRVVLSLVGRHAGKVKMPVSIDEMNEITATGWAGEITDQSETSPECFTSYDPADSLITEDEIAFFLADAVETGDTQYLIRAHEIATRARLRNRRRNGG